MLDYGTLATTALPAIDLKGRNYFCQFPFSWEVADQINVIFGTFFHESGFSEGKNIKVSLFIPIFKVKTLKNWLMHLIVNHLSSMLMQFQKTRH